ncbi:MAG: FtsW/RodA/SpoVE family cell cycle protein, partial [Anaerovorax sp.]
MAKKKLKKKSGDFILTLLVCGLVIFGIIMVFSASYYSAISEYGDPYYYLKRDIIWAIAGFILMTGTTFFNYKIYKTLAPFIMAASAVLLLLLFTPLGFATGGATRWLRVGPLTVMPGEIAKIAVIIFVAWYLSKDPNRIKSFFRGVLPMLAVAGFLFAAIYFQPNLSTAMTIVGIIVGMMFVAGMSLWYFAGIVGLGAVGLVGLVLAKGGFHLRRVLSFLDPFQDPLGDGYQVIQSLFALGSGGLFGVGLGKSIQKTLYLPEPQNDFILAII